MAQIDNILAPGESVNKQLLRQYLAAREIARPEDYGAVGDGVHDDTDAINQALAEARAVQLRACVYRITSPIIMGYGCSLIGMGEATIIQAREAAYNSGMPIYQESFNAIEMVNSYGLIQNMRIVGGATGIKLYGRDGPCVKNIVENVSIWDTLHGIIFDGWHDLSRPCYWNNISRVLIARPKVNGVLFTVTPLHADDPDTYGDTPNANKLHDVRVYSLSAPMTGCGFYLASGRYANSFIDCEANLHPGGQACFRLGFNTDANFIMNFYAESHGALPAIQIDNGSTNTAIHNVFSATGGSVIWDPTLHMEYQAYNAGHPTQNFFKKTWITDLYVEAHSFKTVFINPGAEDSDEIDLDLKSTVYLASAFNMPITLWLPNANDAPGTIVTIKKTDFRQNAITIKERDGNGMDNRTVILENRYDRVTAISNGATWWIVSETNPPLNSHFVQYSDTTSGLYLPTLQQPVYLVSAFSGAIEFRLPVPNQAAGKMVSIKKTDPSSHHVTVTQVAGGGPDAQAQVLTEQFRGMTVFSDGGQWVVISRT